MYIMKENMYYVCQMIILWRFYFQEDSLLQTKLTKKDIGTLGIITV